VQNALNDAGKPVKGSRIHVMGVAYKRDIDDMRESPALDVMLLLQRRGGIVSYSDPHVPPCDNHTSMTWFRVRVPASSANLGAGFDALGMALGVYLTCRFRPSAALAIRAEGRDAASIPTGSDNLIWQTAVSVAEMPRCGDAADRARNPKRHSHRQGHGIERRRAHRRRGDRRPAARVRLETAAHSGRSGAPGRPSG
jgi:hypothetical protein